jgi:hypothetical protein
MKYIFSALLLCLTINLVSAQEFDKQIANAKSSYDAGNYEESRLAVQNALHEINIKIGQEVLAVLPQKVDNMQYIASSDQVSGSGADFTGLFVERTWGSTTAENLEFSVLSDSPLIGTVNTFLALPLVMTSSDSNQKKIKVEGFKAMLEKKVDESANVTGYSLMLPYGKSLLQLNYNGATTEEAFLAMVKQIPVTKVTEIAK